MLKLKFETKNHPMKFLSKNSKGMMALAAALLFYAANTRAQSGTWINLVNGDASGNWGTAANWNNGVIAAGADNTADFSTLDITTNSTVTLDISPTIGNLILGDTTPDNNWLLTGGTLTLQVSSGVPTLTANNGSNTISSVLAGTGGFAKAGAGIIRLSGANNTTLSGNINVNAGILQVANNNALGATTPNGSTTLSNAVVIASGATIQVLGGVQPNLKPAFISGSGVGGAQGAIYADLSGLAQGNTSTRWSISLLTAVSPGVVMTGDTTIRVDGTNSTPLASSMLIGHITTSNALTGIAANYTNYTLTKAGTGQLRIDPANGYTGGNVHVTGGSLAFGNNGDMPGFQTVTVDAGTQLYCRNVTSMNSANSTLVLNGLADLDARGNGNGGSDSTTATQTIGYLAGSGIVTNGSAGNVGVNTLVIGGTNGAATTFSGIIPRCTNGSIGLRIQCTGSTQILAGNNTYTGTTVLNSGTLLVNGSHMGGGAYTVNTGATLGGAGTISSVSPIGLNGGTILAGDPSNPGGTLNLSNSITGATPGAIIISNATFAAEGAVGATGQPAGSLYLTNGTLQVPLSPLAPSVFVSALTVDGNATIAFNMATPLKGQFPIISCGSIGGLAGFAGLSLTAPPGVTASLSNDTANATIDVVITAVPVQTWAGTVNGDWDIGVTANWLGGETYTEPGGVGLIVNFDDSAPGTTSVNLTTTLTPKGVLVNDSTLNYTFSGNGHIQGTGGIVKQGTGTLTVENSGNDFTGGVNLQAGTLQLGNGGTTGDLGNGPIANLGTLALDRSDSFTLGNVVSGNGNLTKSGAGAVTVPVSGDSSGTVTVNAGTLQLGPVGTGTYSGDVTGGGAFGVNGSGTIILTGGNITYGGGTIISNGTLQFNAGLPPAGSVLDNGTLALGAGGTLANTVSGAGGILINNGAGITFGSSQSYAGPTVLLNGTLDATASTYPPGSKLILGNPNGGIETGTADFTAGNPVLGGLVAGGNYNGIGDQLSLGDSGQTLTINGNMSFGNVGPSGAQVGFAVSGTAATVLVLTNGGTIQSGLYSNPNSGNPDSVFVDFSTIDNFVADLGTNGSFNLGTLDANAGPSTGASVVNWFNLASVSNSISAGQINIGAGGRQLVPELRLGAGTNVFNVNTLSCGFGGRDGSHLYFLGGSGGLRVRAYDGVSRAAMAVGNNPATGTGASITNTVDFTGHPVDLLLSTLVIGDYNNAGIYQNTVSFDTGTLDAQSTSLSVIRNNNANAAASGSTLNIGGGTVSLGPVNLTASAAYGTLNITGGTVSVQNITSPGSGLASLNVGNATLNLDLAGFGNPGTSPVAVDAFNVNGPVNLGVNGDGLAVGQFPLISYSGSVGGSGFPALTLASLPANVLGYLSNDTDNSSVDLVITSAPPAINPNPTNILASVNAGQLTLQWDAGHTGWLLQSNSMGLANAGAWVTVTGSGSTNKFTFPVDGTMTNVFFRMLKP